MECLTKDVVEKWLEFAKEEMEDIAFIEEDDPVEVLYEKMVPYLPEEEARWSPDEWYGRLNDAMTTAKENIRKRLEQMLTQFDA